MTTNIPSIPTTANLRNRIRGNFGNVRTALDAAEADSLSAIDEFEQQLVAARTAVRNWAQRLVANPATTQAQAQAVVNAQAEVARLEQAGRAEAAQGNAQGVNNAAAELAQIAATDPATQPAQPAAPAPATAPAATTQAPAQAEPARYAWLGETSSRDPWDQDVARGLNDAFQGLDDHGARLNRLERIVTALARPFGGFRENGDNVTLVNVGATGYQRNNWLAAVIAFVGTILLGIMLGVIFHWGWFSLASLIVVVVALVFASFAAGIPRDHN